MQKTIRHYFHKGDLPGDQALSWWTNEDWDKHEKYVEELKASGEYGKEDYVDISFDPDHFKAFDLPPSDPDKPMFTNFGLIIPSGDNSIPPYINWTNSDT